jgi:hypothetical protein
MIRVANLRCAKCGSTEIVCIDPGEDEVRDLFLLKRETPPRCLCMDCWPVVKIHRREEPQS